MAFLKQVVASATPVGSQPTPPSETGVLTSTQGSCPAMRSVPLMVVCPAPEVATVKSVPLGWVTVWAPAGEVETAPEGAVHPVVVKFPAPSTQVPVPAAAVVIREDALARVTVFPEIPVTWAPAILRTLEA